MDKELQQEVAALMKDSSKREALAEMIVEYGQPGHVTTDFIGMLLNTRSLKLGDSLVKRVRKGIKVYTFVPGSIPLSSEITVSERANYVLDGSVVTVTASEWDINSGELGTLDEMRNEMQLKLRDHYMNKVFTALTTIWTGGNTPSNFTDCGAAVNKTALDNMMKTINQTTNGVKAIAGTRIALEPILDFAGFETYSGSNFQVETIREEIFRTGWLGSYRGTPLVVINQDYNNPEDYTKMVPDNKVLVIGQNVGEFITYGSPNFSQWTDPRPVPPQFYLRIWQQYGFMIDNAMGIGVLKCG